MTADEFRSSIAALGLSLGQAATVLGVHAVTVRSMATGRYAVPLPVQQFLRFAMAMPASDRALAFSAMLAAVPQPRAYRRKAAA